MERELSPDDLETLTPGTLLRVTLPEGKEVECMYVSPHGISSRHSGGRKCEAIVQEESGNGEGVSLRNAKRIVRIS